MIIMDGCKHGYVLHGVLQYLNSYLYKKTNIFTKYLIYLYAKSKAIGTNTHTHCMHAPCLHINTYTCTYTETPIYMKYAIML